MKASENLDAGMKYPKIELARGAVRNAGWSLYRASGWKRQEVVAHIRQGPPEVETRYGTGSRSGTGRRGCVEAKAVEAGKAMGYF